MPPYNRGRRPSYANSSVRQSYRSKQGGRRGGAWQTRSAPSQRTLSVAPSSNGLGSYQRRKQAVSSRNTSSRSQSIASFYVAEGAGSVTSDPGEGLFQDDGLPEESNDVHMALEMKSNGTVGCAYFVSATATLYLHEETRITGFELVESLLFQAQPTSIIVPSRAPEKFIDYLDRQSQDAEPNLPNIDNENRGFSFRTVVSSDFSVDAGKEALSVHGQSSLLQPRAAHFTTAVEDAESYILYGDAEDEGRTGNDDRNKLMQLGTCLNMDNRITLGCAGALVRDIERKRATNPTAGPLKIASIQTIMYKNCMFVTADTLLALQIFHPDIRQAGRSSGTDSGARVPQGGKSIFDLFRSLAATSQGRVKLREHFVRPSTDLQVINGRLDAVTLLLDPANLSTVAIILTALKKIKNIRTLLIQLKKGLFLPGNFATIKHSAWSNLHDFCTNALHILTTGVKSLQDSCDVIGKFLGLIDSDAILRVAEELSRHIDFEESKSSGRSTIAIGISDELDSLKAEYETLQARLGDICERYRAQLPVEAQEDIVGCIFHPQMGYLIVASTDFQTRLNSQAGGSSIGGPQGFGSWEEALREDGLVYYKTDEISRVDAGFGDLTGQIIEVEAQVFLTLGSAVLEEEEALLRASDAIGEIDSMFAFAAGAKAYNLKRPQMTSCNVLHIKSGRHLLHEYSSVNFVPNDCSLAGGSGTGSESQHREDVDRLGLAADSPSAIVVTGPNHSGKSVYLKQAATILFLAHVGCFVPADEAVVGITDKILTRIATRESVSRDESAFGVDLRQAAFSINFATRRSLVLIDEFGKGTATADGAALFEALIDHFLGRGRAEAPKVLAATHFHEIFDDGNFEKHQGLGLSHMSVSIDPVASRPEEKVRFLHVLREGRSTDSFGCNCAAMNGVASSVVERASHIAKLLTQGAELERICLRPREEELEELQKKEQRVRQFLSSMAVALDSSSSPKQPRSLLQPLFGKKSMLDFST